MVDRTPIDMGAAAKIARPHVVTRWICAPEPSQSVSATALNLVTISYASVPTELIKNLAFAKNYCVVTDAVRITQLVMLRDVMVNMNALEFASQHSPRATELAACRGRSIAEGPAVHCQVFLFRLSQRLIKRKLIDSSID